LRHGSAHRQNALEYAQKLSAKLTTLLAQKIFPANTMYKTQPMTADGFDMRIIFDTLSYDES
jgi:3-deoxy-D-arabino-heptulosonate 7-phosphate (DAHP) synthase